MRSGCLVKAILTLGGFIAALAALEIALRIIPYEGHRERDKLSSRFKPYYNSPDPHLDEIHSVPADADPAALLTVNGQRISIAKPAGERRIVFIGDSGTLGSGVSLEASFPIRVKTLLESTTPERRVSVLNAGRKGLSTVGERRLFEDDLVRLKPDSVVLGLFMANDINFNLAHADAETLTVPNAAFLRLFYLVRRHSALAHFSYQRMLALNASRGIVRRLGLQHSPWVPIEFRLIDERGFNLISYLDGEAALYFKSPSRLVSEAFELLGNELVKLRDVVGNAGGDFSIVIIPTLADLTGTFLVATYPDTVRSMEAEGLRINLDELDVTLPRKRMLEICAAARLRCVDPTERLRSLGAEALLPGDDHLSEAGHQAVAEQLVREGIL